MAPSHVVVDGSNIATEGRSTPSLRQLDEAIRQFQDEFPDTEVIVVVDATFGHRIEPSERAIFDEAVAHGELVSPPAGAIGRGDAFVLRVAERVGAQVLSNDSFQEFHAEHPWLFDEGRLMGGKPIPGVGWIFTPRLPVRGPRSRAATSSGSGAGSRTGRRRRSSSEEYVPATPTSPPPGRTSKVAEAAIELATAEAAESAASRGAASPAKAVRSRKAATVAAADGPVPPAKAGRTRKTAKAAATEEPTKTAKASKAPGAKAVKTAKSLKAAKSLKTAKAEKPAKAVKKAAKTPTRAAKATKAVTAAKAAKASKTDKAEKPAKAVKKVAKTATKAAKATKTRRAATGIIPAPDAAADGATGPSSSRRRRRGRTPGAAAVRDAIEVATEEALGTAGEEASPSAPRQRRARRAVEEAPAAVNDPLTFLTFVSEHPLGSSVVGTVSSFVSHGAMVDVNGMSCYLPLTGLGDPPPRRAREVVERGEQRTFVLVALDPPRRGAELALPGLVKVPPPVVDGAEPARAGSRRGRRSGRAAT